MQNKIQVNQQLPVGYFSSSSASVKDPKSEIQNEDLPIFRCSRAEMAPRPVAKDGAFPVPGRSRGRSPNSIFFLVIPD